MRTSSKVGLGIALLMLLVGGVWLLLPRAPSYTPEQLITQSLRDAEEAARRRSASGVMEVVSEDFRSGPWNKKRLQLMVIRSMSQGRGVDYNARVNAPRILPSPRGNPDERLVVSKLSVFYSSTGEDIWGTGPLTFVMRKEERRRWLVFSEPRWRIVAIASLPPIPGYDTGGDLGSL